MSDRIEPEDCSEDNMCGICEYCEEDAELADSCLDPAGGDDGWD